MNAYAALFRDLQARADKGEIKYVALFSNVINTKDVLKATAQAFEDVKSPISSQYIRSGQTTSSNQRDLWELYERK